MDMMQSLSFVHRWICDFSEDSVCHAVDVLGTFMFLPMILISTTIEDGDIISSKIADEEKDTCLELYHEFDSKLKDASTFYSVETAGRDITVDELSILSPPYEPDTYVIDGTYRLQLWADNKKIRSLSNPPLYRWLNSEKRCFSPPAFTIRNAISRARGYLNAFGISISPENFAVATAEYHGNGKNRWKISWTRVIEDYPWDDSSRLGPESIDVLFHEEHGLVLIRNDIFSPAPKSTVVEITREEAIVEAGNFTLVVVSSVKSCELKVASPNWLFPTETRLCWLVEFIRRDPGADQTLGVILPNIIISLDAQTGDVVGMNFSVYR